MQLSSVFGRKAAHLYRPPLFWLSLSLLVLTALTLSAYVVFRPARSVAVDGPPAPEAGVTLVAVGDIMLGRDVAQASQASAEGDDYPFSQVKNLASDDNLLFGNLESPLVTPEHNAAVPQPEQGFRFPARPQTAQALKRAGFSMLTVANNHAFDYGAAGLKDTLDSLGGAGLDYVGAGDQPYAPRYVARGGLKLAFLAATDIPPQSPELAGKQMALFDSIRLLKSIREARSQADVVIVALHWGEEYQSLTSERQREFARQASEAGADVILGAHPHVVGGFEVIGHTVVAYSLGNFVFDGRYPPETRQSVALYLRLDKHGVVSALPVPLKIEGDRPIPLPPTEQAAGLAQLTALTSDPAFKAGALVYNGSDWQSVPALAYVRDHQPDGTINLPKIQTRQVRDLVLDYGGYTTDKAVTDLASQPMTDERFALKDGQLTVWRPDGTGHTWQTVYQTKPGWQVEQMAFGDADDDGRPELMFTMWKNDGKDDAGQFRSHPFVYGWRRGEFRPVWAGSALVQPIREFALADFDNDGHNEMVVLEGNYDDDRHAPARYVTAWRWMGWGYELLYRGPLGKYSSLVYAPGQPYAFFKQQ